MGNVYRRVATVYAYIYTVSLVLSFIALGFAALVMLGVIFAGLFGIL
ncbi:MAG: hypothetical protein SCK28_02495 [Bacillota bacterium]|nr:hypothetical protein [Bacillota bacterium]